MVLPASCDVTPTFTQVPLLYHHHDNHNHNNFIPQFALFFALLTLWVSVNTGSVYCRPQCVRPSKLTVIGSLHAHECLTSKTFLFNLQSTKGSCPPHHKTPWIGSLHYSLTTSSLIDNTITYLTVADFTHMPSFLFHPSIITAFSIRWQHSKIFSHRHTWIVVKFGSTFALVMMFRRVVFLSWLYPLFSLSLFHRPFPFNLVLCHWW